MNFSQGVPALCLRVRSPEKGEFVINDEWTTSTRCISGKCVEVKWVMSAFCGTSACVEVGVGDGVVLMRDAKDRQNGGLLTFSPDAWTDFVQAVKQDRL